MKRFHMRIRLTEDGKKLVACAAAAAAVLALLLFFLLFRVTKIEVVGSTRYTDEEIEGYAMGNPLTSNTVLAILFKSHMEAENIPFVESFDLERLNMHTIRIHVNEKKIVGYVVQGTDKLYFDKDGLVVEQDSMDEEEIARNDAEADELEELKAQALREEALQKAKEAGEALGAADEDEGDEEGSEEEQGEVQQEDTETLQAEEVNYGNEGATEFHAAVTDVPRVIGLATETVTLGEKIETEDDNVFYTILGITRMVEKYQILPEIVYFDEDFQITLVYQQGAIHCKLGKDTLLEEKITRVAAILPKLEGMTGILHLEDYTADTTNIIFSKESLYTLKSTIAAAEGTAAGENTSQAAADSEVGGEAGADAQNNVDTKDADTSDPGDKPESGSEEDMQPGNAEEGSAGNQDGEETDTGEGTEETGGGTGAGA